MYLAFEKFFNILYKKKTKKGVQTQYKNFTKQINFNDNTFKYNLKTRLKLKVFSS